jgi:hypothetical protein
MDTNKGESQRSLEETRASYVKLRAQGGYVRVGTEHVIEEQGNRELETK